MSYVEEIFSLEGQTAVITDGAGAIGTIMSGALEEWKMVSKNHVSISFLPLPFPLKHAGK